MSQFEKIKTAFEFNSADPIIMWLTDIGREEEFDAAGCCDGKYVVPASDMHEEVFKPVVDEIKVHVLRQLHAAYTANDAKPVDYIYMVGGFGCSNYLRKALEQGVSGVPRPPKIVKVEGAQQMISVRLSDWLFDEVY